LYGDATGGGTEIYRSMDEKGFTAAMGDAHLAGLGGYFLTRISLQEKITAPQKTILFYATQSGVYLCNKPDKSGPTWYKLSNSGIADAYRMVCTPDLNTVFVSDENGNIYRSTGLNTATYPPANYTVFNPTNAGIITTKIFNSGGRFMTGIAVDPQHPDTIVVSMANYGSSNYVFKITNALTSTSPANSIVANLQGNLPLFPVYDVALNPYHPEQAIIGTEYGIFTCNNINSPSPVWQEDNNGFPRIPTMQLVFTPDTLGNMYLYAGTHGRGAFYTNSLCGSCGLIDTTFHASSHVIAEPANETFSIFPNPFLNELTLKLNEPAAVSIYYINGQLYKNEMVHGSLIINTEAWPQGVYIVSIHKDNGTILNKKVVKQ
jgi:Secretion system C-terminal sorting domain